MKVRFNAMTSLLVFILSFMHITVHAAFNDSIEVKGNGPNIIIKAVDFKKSQPLRTLKTGVVPTDEKATPNGVLNLQFKQGTYPFAETALPQNGDPVVQRQMGKRGASKLKGISTNFAGQKTSRSPSDCIGAAGPNHYLQSVNASFAIYSKLGEVVVPSTSLSVLFEGLEGASYDDGDPIVLYDEHADRWFVAEFSIKGSNDFMLVGVSATNDPTAEWYTWSFDVADEPDYMKFGVWRDGYYMATNNEDGNDIYVFERDAMLAGEAAPRMVGFVNTERPRSGFHCLMPLDNDGALAPEREPGQFITICDDAWENKTDALWIYELNIDWNDTRTASFQKVQELKVQPFDSNFGSTWSNISQKDTDNKVDAISHILMYRAQYRNFGDHQSVVCAHTVDVNGQDHAGLRWYELRKTSGEWELRQQSTYAPDDLNRWIPSIAMDKNHNIALGYNISGEQNYPGIRYCGQTGEENLRASGILDIRETVVWEGQMSQKTGNRWGDYASMSVDPTDESTFWFAAEYYESMKATRICAFNIDNLFNPIVFDANGISKSEIHLSWKLNQLGENVLLAWSATGEFGEPQHSTTYQVGDELLGGGEVIAKGLLTDFILDELPANTIQYFKIWSLHEDGSYSPGVPESAMTTCASYDLDFTEDFNGEVFPSDCWAILTGKNGLGTQYGWKLYTPDSQTSEAFIRNEELESGQVAEDWLVTPLVNLGNGSKLTFSQKQSSASDFNSSYHIMVSTKSQTNHDDFVEVDSWTELDFTTTHSVKNVDLSQFDNQQVYLAFVNKNNKGDNWFIDDVVLSSISDPKPLATMNLMHDCPSASIELVSNFDGLQTFTLKNDQHVLIAQIERDAYSYVFENLTAGRYYGQVERKGIASEQTEHGELLNVIVKDSLLSICSGEEVLFGDNLLSVSGKYTHVVESVTTCDSIINLDLTVVVIDTEVDNKTTELIAKERDASYQWMKLEEDGLVALEGQTDSIFHPIGDGIYKLMITQNGCSEMSEFLSVGDNAIVVMPSGTIRVYPIPADDHINVEFDKLQGDIEIKLYSINGELMFNRKVNNITSYQLDVNDLTPGLYMLTIVGKDEPVTIKVIKSA
ncbi:T9SS-dependent choice-of-anchor J family protein [Carboxylicivirga marina]|uniref:T9SS type A sorting domain-containing protein n=1 Tax=Carboxylicivirga marina TaxID=2800988 RepID=A0ABS1HGQ9_9BACT|nr:choice-of-anchor J domain-containing protein [Carboxylicivirga marina]MBK3516478.1 T9SS type A sorting domain-containing protein [Carboxylicivirga marina]